MAWQRLRQLQEEDATLEASVMSVNRGGLLVEAASLRGFIPTSHVSVVRAFAQPCRCPSWLRGVRVWGAGSTDDELRCLYAVTVQICRSATHNSPSLLIAVTSSLALVECMPSVIG